MKKHLIRNFKTVIKKTHLIRDSSNETKNLFFYCDIPLNISNDLGPVHTSAFSNVCMPFRKTENASIDSRPHYRFVVYSTVHAKTLENADPIVV